MIWMFTLAPSTLWPSTFGSLMRTRWFWQRSGRTQYDFRLEPEMLEVETVSNDRSTKRNVSKEV